MKESLSMSDHNRLSLQEGSIQLAVYKAGIGRQEGKVNHGHIYKIVSDNETSYHYLTREEINSKKKEANTEQIVKLSLKDIEKTLKKENPHLFESVIWKYLQQSKSFSGKIDRLWNSFKSTVSQFGKLESTPASENKVLSPKITAPHKEDLPSPNLPVESIPPQAIINNSVEQEIRPPFVEQAIKTTKTPINKVLSLHMKEIVKRELESHLHNSSTEEEKPQCIDVVIQALKERYKTKRDFNEEKIALVQHEIDYHMHSKVTSFILEYVKPYSDGQVTEAKDGKYIDHLFIALEQKYPGITFNKAVVEKQLHAIMLRSEVPAFTENYLSSCAEKNRDHQDFIEHFIQELERTYPGIDFDKSEMKQKALEALYRNIRKFAEEELKNLSGGEKAQPFIDALLPKLEEKYPGISSYRDKIQKEANMILYSEVDRFIASHLNKKELPRNEKQELLADVLLALTKKYPGIAFNNSLVEKAVDKALSSEIQRFIEGHLRKMTPETEDINRLPISSLIIKELGRKYPDILFDKQKIESIALDRYLYCAASQFNAIKHLIPESEYVKELTRAIKIDFKDLNLSDNEIEKLGKKAVARIQREEKRTRTREGNPQYNHWGKA